MMHERRITVFGENRLQELPELSSIAQEEMRLADVRAVFANSTEVYAIEYGPRIEGVVGLCGQMFGTRIGMWLVCTQYAGMGFARFMRAELARKLEQYEEIVAETQLGSVSSDRFLDWLGFRCIGQSEVGLVWRIARDH